MAERDKLLAYYDREADIAYFTVRASSSVVSLEEEPGYVFERDKNTNEVVGIEVWHASGRLPQPLLDALALG